MIWSALAPTRASHAPMVITAIRNADARSSRMTTARVALDEAFARFGCSISMPGSAILARPYNLPGARALLGRRHAGVVKFGKHARFRSWCRKAWGFESLRPHRRSRRDRPAQTLTSRPVANIT